MRNHIISIVLSLLLSTKLLASTDLKKVMLNLEDISTGLGDVTEIYFAPGTSPTYIPQEDLRKNFDTTGPQIYSLTSDLVPCYSNGFGDLTRSAVVTIGFQVQEPGTYIFYASILTNFDPGSLILLEDRALGKFIDLRQQDDTIEIALAGQNQERFYLHVSSAPVFNIIPAGCNNDHGIISVNEDSAIRWASVLLFDSNSRLIYALNDTSAGFALDDLSGGNYYMAFTYSDYTFVENIFMTSHEVLLSISTPKTDAKVGQTIQFYSEASNANQYTWNFGDGGIITGIANPDYNYYQPGAYTVSLHASNVYQCSAEAYVNIEVVEQTVTSLASVTIDSITVFSYDKNVVITTTNMTEASYTCEIYNLAGQLLVISPITSPYFVLNLFNEAAGIYFVQIKTPSGSFTRKIFLSHI